MDQATNGHAPLSQPSRTVDRLFFNRTASQFLHQLCRWRVVSVVLLCSHCDMDVIRLHPVARSTGESMRCTWTCLLCMQCETLNFMQGKTILRKMKCCNSCNVKHVISCHGNTYARNSMQGKMPNCVLVKLTHFLQGRTPILKTYVNPCKENA